MTPKKLSEKEVADLVKALREYKPNHEYLSKYWEQRYINLLDFIRQVADSSPSDRTKLLKPYKSKRENSTLNQVKNPRGRPRVYTTKIDDEFLKKFEAVKDHYIKTERFEDKRVNDKETVIIALKDQYKKKGSRQTKIHSEEVKSKIKSLLNKINIFYIMFIGTQYVWKAIP